jgi:hypothetical protein
MPTPQFNVRVPERYHDLLRLIVERLRANPDGADALADALSAVCRQSAGRGASDADRLSAAADSLPSSAVSDRLDAIEARLASGASLDPQAAADLEDLKVRIALLPEILDRLTQAEDTARKVMAFAESINEGLVKEREARAVSPPDPASGLSAKPRHAANGKRRSPTPVTPDLRRQAHDMRGTGMTQDAIAKALEIGTGTVSKILKNPRPAD